MRVLAVLPLYPPTSRVGAFLATHEMLAHLARRGHEVTVQATMGRGQRPRTHEGVKVEFGGKHQIADAAKSADVVVTHLPIGAAVAKVAGKPCVQMGHGADLTAFDGTTLIVANSQSLADSIQGGVRTVVCHPYTRPELHLVEETGDAITIINCSREKGSKQFARIAERMPDRRFLAVKGGYGSQDLPRSSNVEVWPVQADMRTVWAQTRILLVPSLHETWSMVAVEAGLNGIPVIGSRTPGLDENPVTAGHTIDRDDTSAWVTVIAALTAGQYDVKAWGERDLIRHVDHYAERSAGARAAAESIPDHRDRFADEIEALVTKPAVVTSRSPKVAVVIPYRPVDEHRIAAFETVVAWWRTITRGEWEIIPVDDGGELFSRGASIAAGIAQTDADVIVAADGDLLVGRQQMVDAVTFAAAEPGLVQPFDRLWWFDEAATAALLAAPHLPWTLAPPRARYDWRPNANTPLLGGLNVFSRRTWELAGGFLPGFRGWGSEDLAFEAQCSTLAGPTRRTPGIVAHLYHPKTDAYTSRTTVNAGLADRVVAARGDIAAMRALVDVTMRQPCRVEAGWGAATPFMEAAPGLFPIEAHPGTLNVRLTEPASLTPDGKVVWFDETVPWVHATVNGVGCIMLGADHDMDADCKVELIAPVHLRSTLNVADGDLVDVEVR